MLMNTSDKAEKIVSTLLEERPYSGDDSERPGSPDDPWRKTTNKLSFPNWAFSGKRANEKRGDDDDDDDEEKEEGDGEEKKGGVGKPKEGSSPPSRFKMKFGEHSDPVMRRYAVEADVAKKPGSVTYKNPTKASAHVGTPAKGGNPAKSMKKGKTMSGSMVASKPGKVKHESIDDVLPEPPQLDEAGSSSTKAKLIRKPGGTMKVKRNTVAAQPK